MSKRSFGSYIAELAIVIIGVTVAFWISTISEKQKEREVRNNYYSELIEDINSDIKDLEFAKKLNLEKQEQLERAIVFYKEPSKYKDSIVQAAFLVGSYFFFEPDDITYQSIIASGDLKMIQDKEIKKGLVRLYGIYHSIEKMQEGFLEALDQNYFPLLVQSVDYSSGEIVDPNFTNDVQVKNYIMYTINELNMHIKWYELALKRGEKMISMLESAAKQKED